MTQYNGNNLRYIILTVVLGFLATLSVILRFVSRVKTRQSFGADEWLAVLALNLLYAYMGMALWSGENGAGYNPLTLPPDVLVSYLKAAYIGGALAPATISAAKFSVLCLYYRVFSVDKQFRLSLTIVGILCAAWCVAATIGILLKCVPVVKSWNVTVPGYCFNLSVFAVAIEVPNSLLDFVIVALPVRVIRQLQLSLGQKISISLVFILGGFVGVIGFIRIAINYKPSSFSNLDTGVWLLVQLGIGVICCCLTTFRPLLPKGQFLTHLKSQYTKLLGRSQRHRSSLSSSGMTRPNKGSTQQPWQNRYNNVGDAEGDTMVLTSATGGIHDGDKHTTGETGFPLNTISVRRSVEIV